MGTRLDIVTAVAESRTKGKHAEHIASRRHGRGQESRHCRRRHGRLGRGDDAVQAFRQAARHHAGRVRRDRHGRRRRIHRPADRRVPQLVRHRRAATSCASARPRSRSASGSRTGRASATSTSIRSAATASPRGWRSSTTSGCTRARRARRCRIGEYCYEWLAAMKGRFALRENPRINYAYHFDAALYARYLRKLSEPQGRQARRGQDQAGAHARRQTASSNRSSSRTARSIDGDFFIDCTGFRGAAHRRRAADGLRRLVALAALRQRRSRSRPSSTSRPQPVHRLLRARRRLALEHSRAAPRRQRRRVLQPVHVGRRGAHRAGHGFRRHAGQGALAGPHQGGPAQEGVEQERGGVRARERIRRAAGIHQHPHDHDGRGAAGAPLPVRRRERSRWSTATTSCRSTRSSASAISSCMHYHYNAARRHAVLAALPRDGDPGFAARARRTVPPGRVHLQAATASYSPWTRGSR